MAEHYYKTVRLVPPACANQFGIPTEAPIFLSPLIATRMPCELCSDHVFSPLPYQTGYVTTAQHFHLDCGGIYCYIVSSPSVLAAIAERTGFVAQLEPIGRLKTESIQGEICARAEAVRTIRIMAYCLHPATATQDLAHQHPSLMELSAGILLIRPAADSAWRRLSSDTTPGDLLPLCGTEELHPDEQAPFSFFIREGTLVYRQRRLP